MRWSWLAWHWQRLKAGKGLIIHRSAYIGLPHSHSLQPRPQSYINSSQHKILWQPLFTSHPPPPHTRARVPATGMHLLAAHPASLPSVGAVESYSSRLLSSFLKKNGKEKAVGRRKKINKKKNTHRKVNSCQAESTCQCFAVHTAPAGLMAGPACLAKEGCLCMWQHHRSLSFSF